MRAWLVAAGVAATRRAPSGRSPRQSGFFADYAGQSSWSPSRGELRAIGVPVAVVTGPATAPHVVAAADAIARLVPGARRADDGDVVAAVARARRAGAGVELRRHVVELHL